MSSHGIHRKSFFIRWSSCIFKLICSSFVSLIYSKSSLRYYCSDNGFGIRDAAMTTLCQKILLFSRITRCSQKKMICSIRLRSHQFYLSFQALAWIEEINSSLKHSDVLQETILLQSSSFSRKIFRHSTQIFSFLGKVLNLKVYVDEHNFLFSHFFR